jgi:hypothetical protein
MPTCIDQIVEDLEWMAENHPCQPMRELARQVTVDTPRHIALIALLGSRLKLVRRRIETGEYPDNHESLEL